MKMPDQNLVNQPDTWAVVQARSDFALGAPMTVLRQRLLARRLLS